MGTAHFTLVEGEGLQRSQVDHSSIATEQQNLVPYTTTLLTSQITSRVLMHGVVEPLTAAPVAARDEPEDSRMPRRSFEARLRSYGFAGLVSYGL